GSNEILKGAVARAQMIQYQVHTARIQERVVPGQNQVDGPVTVRHEIQSQTWTCARMQVASEKWQRQNSLPLSVNVLVVVFAKDGPWLGIGAPKRRQHAERTLDARAGQPIEDC